MTKLMSLLMLVVMVLIVGCSGRGAAEPVEPGSPVVAEPGPVVAEPVQVPEPEAPVAGPDIWPGVPAYPGVGVREGEWGHHLTVPGVGVLKVLAWYREALLERGWVEEAVSDPEGFRLVMRRDGLYVILGASEYNRITYVTLQHRENLVLTEAQAMDVAKVIIGNHEQGVSWEVRFEEEYASEPKGDGLTRPTWVIGRVYAGGNKEVVYVDALTAEPYIVATIEGPGFGVEK